MTTSDADTRARDLIHQSLINITEHVYRAENYDLRVALIAHLTDFVAILRSKEGYPTDNAHGRSATVIDEVHSPVVDTTVPTIDDDPVPVERPERDNDHRPESRYHLSPPRVSRRNLKRRLSLDQRRPSRESSPKRPMTAEPDKVGTKRQRPSRPTSSHQEETALPIISRVPLTPSCSPDALLAGRESFFQEVKDMSVTILRDNKEDTVTFTLEEAKEITSVLVDGTTSMESIQRLGTFIDAYNKMRKDEPDLGAAVRAERLAVRDGTPILLRQFYGTFSRNQSSRHNAPAAVQYMEQIVQGMRLLEQYDKIRSQAEKREEELLDFLRSKGHFATKGRTWVTVTIDYIAEQLQMERHVLVNTCQRARGVQELIQAFGEGILFLLAPAGLNKLRRIGNQRMAPVYKVLQRHLPQLQHICDVLHARWYTPYSKGSKQLPLVADPHAAVGPSHSSYIEMIQAEAADD